MDFAQTLPAMFKIASFSPFYPQNASPAFHWWKVWLIKLLSKKAPPSISTVPSRVSQRPCARGQMADATIKCVQVKKKLVLGNSRGNEGICSNSGPICCRDLRELKGFFWFFCSFLWKDCRIRNQIITLYIRLWTHYKSLLLKTENSFSATGNWLLLKDWLFVFSCYSDMKRVQLGKTSLWILNPSLWYAVRHSELDAGLK